LTTARAPERAADLGAEIRRGHELVSLAPFTVSGPDGEYHAEPQYVVGCDGAHSRVREPAGIGFPGTTDGELMRPGHFRGNLPLFGSGPARGWNRRPGGRVLDRLTGEDGDALRTLPYVPDLPPTVGGEPTRVAEIMRAARTVPFDFADRADLRKAAGPGVKIVTAACPDALGRRAARASGRRRDVPRR